MNKLIYSIIVFTLLTIKSFSSSTFVAGENIRIENDSLRDGMFKLGYRFIYERIFTTPTTGSDNINYIDNITYYDGFNREIQIISRDGSPIVNTDLIQPKAYGIHGRKEKEFLIYPKTNNKGLKDKHPYSSSNYSYLERREQKYAYSMLLYDNSPLERVVQQVGPGASWYTGAKDQKNLFGRNASNFVIIWNVNNSGDLVYENDYRGQSLYKETHVDEDGHKSSKYMERDGRVILEVKNVNDSTYLKTYYVYDERGLLRWVLSPEASAKVLNGISINKTVLRELAYYYDYDSWGRLIEKKLPGCDPVYMIYDQNDRLVMKQDGKQRIEDTRKWSYTLYDNQNRVIETGEVISSETSRANLQNTASSTTNYVPLGTRVPLQYILYDSYKPTTDVSVLSFQATPGYSSKFREVVTGLATSIKTRVLGTNTWLTTTTYYDDQSRIIQTANDNLQGRVSRVDMKYDFVGNMIQQREKHEIKVDQADIFEIWNSYDKRGRLLSTTAKLNNGSPATVSYTYDIVGRLVKKKYGKVEESMTYNPRGWLTCKESIPFKMKLRYEKTEGGNTAYWNGNISEWEWQQGTNATLMYSFTYDGINRLTGSTQQQKTGTSWINCSNNYTEKGISYDYNGNIMTLQRTAKGNTVDNLVYNYTGNQLASLKESLRTSPVGDIYLPGSTLNGTYTYDANGNMINDSRKALNLSYNVLNLLSEVKAGNVTKAKYYYLADGTKLRVRDAGSNGFDYLGSLTYSSNSAGLQLESAHFGDGVILTNNSSSKRVETNYFLTDHLGSTRVVIDENGVVKERNDYYPSGAKHVTSDYPQEANNRYKYNGKEEQVTGDLKYLDYGSRMYDSGVIRWFCIDPKAENDISTSGYTYCNGNPVLFIDPNGEMTDWYRSWDKSAYIWKDSQLPTMKIGGETYFNIGSSFSMSYGDKYYNYYQNVPVSISNVVRDAKTTILNNDNLLGDLLSNRSPLGTKYQQELFNNSIHNAQKAFLEHPVTQATLNSLLFVATGGIEGVVELGGLSQSLFTTIKSGGKSFAQYKAARGGTETLAKIMTSSGEQRISTEFHHLFLTQKIQRTYNLPNWLVNNRINVIKVNTIQHSLLDSYRFNFLRSSIKSEVGWIKKYNWFTKFN
ncbi:DUF6443 domain-containing protein [Butyricimonas virosa]|jgi:hypothetical protein